jgi:hypothetical protein
LKDDFVKEVMEVPDNGIVRVEPRLACGFGRALHQFVQLLG